MIIIIVRINRADFLNYHRATLPTGVLLLRINVLFERQT